MNEDKMELEEAIKELQERIEMLNRHIKSYEKSNCKYTFVLQLVKEKEATETVLKALENSIPKKKIEDKIKQIDYRTANGEERYYQKAILQELLENK